MSEEARESQPAGAEPADGSPSNNGGPLTAEEQVAVLRRDLAEAQREAGQNRDLAQRAQAELVNYRRRADEERTSSQKYSNGRLIVRLLPVIDDLDLAIHHAGARGSDRRWLEGVKLIQRKLSNLLESEGVVKIDAVGMVFNPVEHEALGTQETAEHPPGQILEVVRAGYRLHDRVIQPAQVIVARERQNLASPDRTS